MTLNKDSEACGGLVDCVLYIQEVWQSILLVSHLCK